jgi:hypothetical protein
LLEGWCEQEAKKDDDGPITEKKIVKQRNKHQKEQRVYNYVQQRSLVYTVEAQNLLLHIVYRNQQRSIQELKEK